MLHRHRFVGRAGTVGIAVLALAGCSSDGGAGSSAPRVKGAQADDPELVTGRRVFVGSCARCHGSTGGGGAIAPQLSDGRVARVYPNLEDQLEVIRDGRGNMPSFGGLLTEQEIRSVARYEREVL